MHFKVEIEYKDYDFVASAMIEANSKDEVWDKVYNLKAYHFAPVHSIVCMQVFTNKECDCMACGGEIASKCISSSRRIADDLN